MYEIERRKGDRFGVSVVFLAIFLHSVVISHSRSLPDELWNCFAVVSFLFKIEYKKIRHFWFHFQSGWENSIIRVVYECKRFHYVSKPIRLSYIPLAPKSYFTKFGTKKIYSECIKIIDIFYFVILVAFGVTHCNRSACNSSINFLYHCTCHASRQNSYLYIKPLNSAHRLSVGFVWHKAKE